MWPCVAKALDSIRASARRSIILPVMNARRALLSYQSWQKLIVRTTMPEFGAISVSGEDGAAVSGLYPASTAHQHAGIWLPHSSRTLTAGSSEPRELHVWGSRTLKGKEG